MFVAGQERVKSLESRAERENTKSDIRLIELSDKLQGDFTPTAFIPDREVLDHSSRTAVSERSIELDEQLMITERSSDEVCNQFHVKNSR